MQQGFNTSIIAVRIVTAESAWRAASLCLKVNSTRINGKPILFFLRVLHGDVWLVGTYCFVVRCDRGVVRVLQEAELEQSEESSS